MATNVLILIHGMVPEPEPKSQDATYDAFWTAIREARPELGGRMKVVKVEWGHELPDDPPPVRDDHQLTLAEQFAFDRVGYHNVRKVQDPNNVVRSGVRYDIGIPALHQLITGIRETVLLFGLSDVVYYCSPDGEARVRQEVYEQVLDHLQAHVDEERVRLHVFAHSLGVTIAHDFLFGLFNRDTSYTPGFVRDRQGSSEEAHHRFMRWREKAQAGRVELGGFAAAASQLPLLLMRKQGLVRKLYQAKQASNAGQRPVGVDAADIGIRAGDKTQWKLFYDTDDLLGFPSRGLYTLPDGRPHPAIMDFQVNCGVEPFGAHVGYWTDHTVIHEAAQLFAEWIA
jgi:hypothetical protein